MKRYAGLLLMWMCGATAGFAAMGERILIVKVLNYDKTVTMEIKTADEFKAIQSEIREESRFYPKALALARQAWAADEKNARKPFPVSAVTERQALPVGQPYSDREKAQAKLDRDASRVADKEADEVKRRQEAREKEVKDRGKESVEAAEARDADREALARQAVQLFLRKLEEARSGGGRAVTATPVGANGG